MRGIIGMPALCAVLFVAPCARAYDTAGKWDTVGMGTQQCGTWSHYRQEDPKSSSAQFLLSWVEGYVSAINQYVPTTSTSLAAGLGERGIGLWFDSYCADHQSETLDVAATNFVLQRVPKPAGK